MKRPAFWILLAVASLAATAAAIHYFPQAFSIVALDITMTRERALDEARAIMPHSTQIRTRVPGFGLRENSLSRKLIARPQNEEVYASGAGFVHPTPTRC